MSAHRDELVRQLAVVRAQSIQDQRSARVIFTDSLLYLMERVKVIEQRFPSVAVAATTDPDMERVTGADALRDISEGSGAQEIMMERWRQIMHEGFDAEHDDAHDESQLAWAAVCYAAPETVYRQVIDQHNLPRVEFRDPWPWAAVEDKRRPGDITTDERVRELVKAGALIAAEIDRLRRSHPLKRECSVECNGWDRPPGPGHATGCPNWRAR